MAKIPTPLKDRGQLMTAEEFFELNIPASPARWRRFSRP